MDNPNDLYADFILLDAFHLADVDDDPHIAANSLAVVYE